MYLESQHLQGILSVLQQELSRVDLPPHTQSKIASNTLIHSFSRSPSNPYYIADGRKSLMRRSEEESLRYRHQWKKCLMQQRCVVNTGSPLSACKLHLYIYQTNQCRLTSVSSSQSSSAQSVNPFYGSSIIFCREGLHLPGRESIKIGTGCQLQILKERSTKILLCTFIFSTPILPLRGSDSKIIHYLLSVFIRTKGAAKDLAVNFLRLDTLRGT